MKIEIEETFKESLKKGVNLFLGAGFSLESKNYNNEVLPLANDLSIELSNNFNTPLLDLSKITAIIESRDKEGLYSFLRKKYTVKEFDAAYKSIGLLNIKNIYTTNIDNLIFKIFEDSHRYYINDISIQGPSFRDRNAINYYPLHGCVLNTERPMIFSSLAMASTFSANPRIWNDLSKSVETQDTIFWGYSLSDPGILETLSSIKTGGIQRGVKWIVLHRENPTEEEYFKALGFKIIICSNNELLNYFQTTLKVVDTKTTQSKKTTKELFGEEFVPSNRSAVPVREVNEFYLGAAPTWSDIFRSDLYKTSHFEIIKNSIYSDSDTIVIGITGSGKTTLMMQLAAFTDFKGHKIILESPSIGRVKSIIGILQGEKALVFIDNFTEDIDSFLEFKKQSNIKLVGFDREHNFEIISHMINRSDFHILSVTTLTPFDVQEIYSHIPANIKTPSLQVKKNEEDEYPSLFEFLNLNLRLPGINERYKALLDKLDGEDELLSEFLVLTSYVHYARTPLSFDMVFSYFGDDISSYHEIYEMRDKLGSLLVDNPITLYELDDQDYFTTRSVILSEVIIEQVNSRLLKRVLNKFIENLPPYKIINYRTFRRRAHDKYIAIRAYQHWQDGKNFYEKVMQYDPKNPFLLQQGALYLSFKKQHNEAFYWIDQARNMSGGAILSIRNSHAIILFQANINREGPDVRATLDSSMAMLVDCYKQDKRKLYHAKKFAEQSIEYYDRFGGNIALGYLAQAKEWIEEELRTHVGYKGGLTKLLKEIRKRFQ